MLEKLALSQSLALDRMGTLEELNRFVFYLAIVKPHTFFTPLRFNTLAASFMIAPVV